MVDIPKDKKFEEMNADQQRKYLLKQRTELELHNSVLKARIDNINLKLDLLEALDKEEKELERRKPKEVVKEVKTK